MTARLSAAESFLLLLDNLAEANAKPSGATAAVMLQHAAGHIRDLLAQVEAMERDADETEGTDALLRRASANARLLCPEHGLLCKGEGCCCADLHKDVPRPGAEVRKSVLDGTASPLEPGRSMEGTGPAAPDLGWPAVLLASPAPRFACGYCGSFRWSSSDGLTMDCGDCGRTGPLVQAGTEVPRARTGDRPAPPEQPGPGYHNGHRPPEWECIGCLRRFPGRRPERGLCIGCSRKKEDAAVAEAAECADDVVAAGPPEVEYGPFRLTEADTSIGLVPVTNEEGGTG